MYSYFLMINPGIGDSFEFDSKDIEWLTPTEPSRIR